MTDSVNQALTSAEHLFKSLVWDTMVKLGLEALFADVAVLNVWPFRPLITSLVNLSSEHFFNALVLVIDLQAVVFLNNEHKRAFDAAAVKLKVIAHDKGIESPEFLKAREDAKLELSHFVRYGN